MDTLLKKSNGRVVMPEKGDTGHRYTIASASWMDHLVFGEGDGKLNSPEAVARRMEAWRREMGATVVHWREMRTRARFSHYYSTPDNPRTQEKILASLAWDDFEVVPRVAHGLGMRAQLYVSVMDDGRPLPSDEDRGKSFHNAMHGQHATFQTDWSRDHPEFVVESRDGSIRQWGVLCLAYPEVRWHLLERILKLVEGYEFDGVFVCLRSQSRPADFADQFGFNEPLRSEMLAATGKDIRIEDFDLPTWRAIQGSCFTRFLRDLKDALSKRGMTLGVGIPRGDIIGPPIGNWELQWRAWIRERIVDELVVDQDSSRCPSMWHPLWPMLRGYGYLQNHIDGKGLLPLKTDLETTYAPVVSGSAAKLYVARQWHAPDLEEEEALLATPGVSGLAFSTFRYDNPAAIHRGDFRA
jgi:hypothetical protein